MTSSDRHDTPTVGDLAWHRNRDLEPRLVVKTDGQRVWLNLAGSTAGPFPAAQYAYSTPKPTRQGDALRTALEAQRGTDYPGVTTSIPTSAELHALAQLMGRTRAAVEGAGGEAVTMSTGNLRRLEHLVTDAALYGYPRPPLEQLGAQAGHLPASRSSDPATARESGERTRSAPSARNHLGKLLRTYRIRADTMPDDPGMTSEQAAQRCGLAGSEYAKRCSDLLALGYLKVAQDDDGHDRTRQGHSGRQRLVFELTDDGRRLADEILEDEFPA